MQNLAAEKLGEYEIAPQVAQLLKNPNWRIQNVAAKALREIKAKEFASQVAQLLKEKPDHGGVNIRYAALELREKLIQYAADTKDHKVSDNFC